MAEIKNLKKAALRIKAAAKNQERIVLYGDADVDGVTAVLILEQAILSLGGSVTEFYFAEREKEGYGVTKSGLKKLQKLAPALLISADIGISNFEEMKLAKKAGFDVIIVDHHVVLREGLPEADIIVDPKQPGDSYPFKNFAACGLAWKVAEAAMGKKMSPSLKRSMLELAALGTIADMMAREMDNLKIIEEGTEAFSESWRPGIRTFLEREPYSTMNVNVQMEQLIGIMNARVVKDGHPASYWLLAASSTEEAEKLLTQYTEENRIRKDRIQQLVEKVRKDISTKIADPLVFEGGADFDFSLLGAVASMIAREYNKPTFLYKKRKDNSIGSVRAPSGFDTVQAMQSCADLLITFGGHPPASGFTVPAKNIQKFRRKLTEYFSK